MIRYTIVVRRGGEIISRQSSVPLHQLPVRVPVCRISPNGKDLAQDKVAAAKTLPQYSLKTVLDQADSSRHPRRHSPGDEFFGVPLSSLFNCVRQVQPSGVYVTAIPLIKLICHLQKSKYCNSDTVCA